MDLYPLPGQLLPPDLDRLRQQGDVRRIRHGPMTVAQVLERARREMDEQDRAEAEAADPVLWVRARRRRTLLNRLLGRC